MPIKRIFVFFLWAIFRLRHLIEQLRAVIRRCCYNPSQRRSAMETRLDSVIDSRGGFSLAVKDSPIIHGRLHYYPEKGIELELVENPLGSKAFGPGGLPPMSVIYGKLVDGTIVTLSDCFIS